MGGGGCQAACRRQGVQRGAATASGGDFPQQGGGAVDGLRAVPARGNATGRRIIFHYMENRIACGKPALHLASKQSQAGRNSTWWIGLKGLQW